MIDRKISVVTTQKAKDQAIRQSDALKNNKMTGRWEVPNQTQANRAQKMFDELGIKNMQEIKQHTLEAFQNRQALSNVAQKYV